MLGQFALSPAVGGAHEGQHGFPVRDGQVEQDPFVILHEQPAGTVGEAEELVPETLRGQEAVQEAIGVAEKNQNQQVEPEHLLAAMLEQKEGVVRPIFGKIGANIPTITTDLSAAIAKFPKVEGGQQFFSSRTNTIFQDAASRCERNLPGLQRRGVAL